MNECHYCNEKNEDIYFHEAGCENKEDLYVFVNDNGLRIEIFADTSIYSGVFQINIKHCPMCGRELNGTRHSYSNIKR